MDDLDNLERYVDFTDEPDITVQDDTVIYSFLQLTSSLFISHFTRLKTNTVICCLKKDITELVSQPEFYFLTRLFTQGFVPENTTDVNTLGDYIMPSTQQDGIDYLVNPIGLDPRVFGLILATKQRLKMPDDVTQIPSSYFFDSHVIPEQSLQTLEKNEDRVLYNSNIDCAQTVFDMFYTFIQEHKLLSYMEKTKLFTLLNKLITNISSEMKIYNSVQPLEVNKVIIPISSDNTMKILSLIGPQSISNTLTSIGLEALQNTNSETLMNTMMMNFILGDSLKKSNNKKEVKGVIDSDKSE